MRAALLIALGCVACKGASSTASVDGGDDTPDAAIPCGPGGVSKGPWVLAVDETHATVRWEACRAGTASGVSISPESGGAAVHADALESRFDVTEETLTPLNPDFPDRAGAFFMHEAKLQGLGAAACYGYVLDADPSYSGRFCTARAPGSAVRFMAIGDTNPTLGDNTKSVLAHALPEKPDFVLHGGDIEYYSSGFETWATWFPIMAPMLRAGAFFPAIGNHESEKPGEYAQYTLRFFGNAGFDGTEAYYRFSSGGVWFFSVDTEESVTPGSAEGTWLLQALDDAVKKPGYRFGVIYFHKPFVTCGDTGDDPAAYQYWAPIFKAHKVPLVLQAHMHGYERFTLDGVTYVTSAGGGGIMGDVSANTGRAYCAQRSASGTFFHAMIFDVPGTGPISGRAIDREGAVRDTFQIAPP
jgi:Calcineurin-like phosphoesterase